MISQYQKWISRMTLAMIASSAVSSLTVWMKASAQDRFEHHEQYGHESQAGGQEAGSQEQQPDDRQKAAGSG